MLSFWFLNFNHLLIISIKKEVAVKYANNYGFVESQFDGRIIIIIITQHVASTNEMLLI